MGKSINYLSSGDTNSKTTKNKRETLILYLSPHKANKYSINMCPKASSGCIESCLFTAGRGVFKNVADARMRKTEAFINDRKEFLDHVSSQIRRKALRMGSKQLAVRLNGTSDVKLVEMMLKDHELPSNVVFYDYTKIKQKAGDRVINGHRYMVTFSRSGTNDKDCIDVLEQDGIVAVVFDEMPKTWAGYPVVDGDKRDDLMLDIDGGSVLGLKAKGRAKYDTTGFVYKQKCL